MRKSSDWEVKRAMRRFWRTRDRAADRLLSTGRREFGEIGLNDALSQFLAAVGLVDFEIDEDRISGDDPRMALFVPWFLFHWLPDEAPAGDDWPSEHTIAARFLQSLRQRGKFLDRYVDAARREPFTFWEVLDVEPGGGMRLKDLLLDREVRVVESSGSSNMRPWTIMFGQVVEIDDLSVLHASLPVAFPPHVRAPVETATARFMGRQVQNKTDLLAYDLDMLMIMGQVLDGLFEAASRAPVLQNTDGQELVWTTSRYAFDPGSRDEVNGCVASIEDMHAHGETEDGETDFGLVVDQPGNRMMPNVSKGRVLIGDGVLTTACNSVERDEAMRQLLEAACGDRLTYETTETQELDLEEMQREAGAPQPRPRSGIAPELEAKLPPDDRAALIGVMRDKFLAWADDTIPALGNVTPREAVKTPEGRKKVIELIKGLEHMVGGQAESMEWQDFDVLRTTLGLTAEE